MLMYFRHVDEFTDTKSPSMVLAHPGIGKRAQHVAIYTNDKLSSYLVYVKLLQRNDNNCTIVVLSPSTENPDKLAIVDEFEQYPGTCIQIVDNYLYSGGASTIYRYEINPDTGFVINKNNPKLILRGVQSSSLSDSPIFVIDDKLDRLYVHIASPTNSCQSLTMDRKVGKKGEMPCSRLKYVGNVWVFRASKTNQTLDMGILYSQGIRKMRSMALYKEDDEYVLYGIIQGRDSLHKLYPKLYTKEQGELFASDELVRIEQNTQFGYPYCYWDGDKGKRILSPEYGGNGKNDGHCNSLIDKPLAIFNHHRGPNDIMFADNKLFIVWNGKPQPLKCDKSCASLSVDYFGKITDTGEFQDYKTLVQFTRTDKTKPSGIAMCPDKSILITESLTGKIWRISQ